MVRATSYTCAIVYTWLEHHKITSHKTVCLHFLQSDTFLEYSSVFNNALMKTCAFIGSWIFFATKLSRMHSSWDSIPVLVSPVGAASLRNLHCMATACGNLKIRGEHLTVQLGRLIKPKLIGVNLTHHCNWESHWERHNCVNHVLDGCNSGLLSLLSVVLPEIHYGANELMI